MMNMKRTLNRLTEKGVTESFVFRAQLVDFLFQL